MRTQLGSKRRPPASLRRTVKKPPLQLALTPPRERARDEERDSTAWYESWWFWTSVGVVTVGVVSAVFLLQPDPVNAPQDYDIEIGVQ